MIFMENFLRHEMMGEARKFQIILPNTNAKIMVSLVELRQQKSEGSSLKVYR